MNFIMAIAQFLWQYQSTFFIIPNWCTQL